MPIDYAHPGRSRLLNAAEHNSMASAVNYVEATSQIYRGTARKTDRREHVSVVATQFIRAGTLVELGGPVVDITADFPPTSSKSWITGGQTQNTGILQNVRAVYGYSPLQDSTKNADGVDIWDAGRGSYGIANSAIMRGDVGRVQTAGIAAARIRLQSLDDVIAFPGTSNLTGLHGVLQGALTGRSGMLIVGKPKEITDEYPYTWAYVMIGSFKSPYATRVRAKLLADLTESDTEAYIKDLVPFDGLLPKAWKESDYEQTVQNEMGFAGSTNFYCDVAYNVQQDKWQLTGVQC